MTKACRHFIYRIHGQLCVCTIEKKNKYGSQQLYLRPGWWDALLQVGSLASSSPALVVSTLVAVGPSPDVASIAPAPPGTGLAILIDGDTGGCAEGGGPTTSHPLPPWQLQYIKLHCIHKLFVVTVIRTFHLSKHPSAQRGSKK